jgi:hypothetical protein
VSDGTRVDVQSAHLAAQRLTALGNGLAVSWAGHKAEIQRLHAAEPWGHDEPGQTFDKGYLKGGDPASAPAQVIAGADALVARLRKLGPLVRSAVDGVVSADQFAGEVMKASGQGSPSTAV